jgi:hypothetical protein
MPLKNYTTSIGVFKTIGEIEEILVEHGAWQIMKEYDSQKQVAAVCFSINTPFGINNIRLPAKVSGVQKVLEQQRETSRQAIKCDKEHATRVAWRNVKDWIDAQMAMIEADMVSMEEVFFPYLLDNNGKMTLFEAYREKQMRLMSGGNTNA